MKKTILALLLALAATSCAPSQAAIEKAIAETQTALPPTATPRPTPAPTAKATEDPCPLEGVKAYVAAVNTNFQRWNDELTIAGNAPRISLPPIIEEMQAVRREARLLTPPLCAKKVQEEYLAYLDDGIKATVDWMGENVRGSQEAVDASKIHLDAFVAGLQQLVKSFGAP